MRKQSIIHGRRRGRGKPTRKLIVRAAFARPAAGGASVLEYPGYASPDAEDKRRTFVTGSISTLLHFAGLALLLFIASLAPVIEETLIPVQLIPNETPPPPEPAAAPKALATRSSLDYAPAVQAVQPQIVNPKVIARAAPAVRAEALQMDSVGSVTAPTQINRATTVVERVSAVSSVARATASSVDVAHVGAPVVRGPTRIDAPVGPSVGPRKVEAANTGNTVGTAPYRIGGKEGSSVRDGVLSNMDVVGSPDGAAIVSVNTAIGDGYLRGTGGTGTGTSVVSKSACFERASVRAYLVEVKDRTIGRWVLPPGLSSDQTVTLRFNLDAAGSASRVSLVDATDNALGASAVDALRAAAPFPPMPSDARCLSQVPIVATFSNPVAG
jgi:TonB family protein